MGSCQVCTEPFNKSTRSKITCPYGDCCFTACKTCVRTYILNTTTDPHCMNCRKAFNQKFVVESLNRSFFDGDYKKHRKQLLLDNELSRMADTMVAAQRQKQIDTETVKFTEQQKICLELRKQLKTETLKLRELSINIHRIRNGNNDNANDSERRKFIMPCPSENCNGYLSSQYKCGLCTMFTCPDCFELIGYNKTDAHTCNDDCVKSAEMIKKDTRPCPNCGIRIHKIAGCNQMWCVECKTGFNYETGHIDKGPIHNPHFYQWQATQNNGITPRNPGDIACGGLIQLRELRQIRILITAALSDPTEFKKLNTQFDNLHRAVSHITYYDLPHIRTSVRNLEDNEGLRIKYILNKKTKSELSTDILRNDNSRRKLADTLHIYELLSVVGIETFANMIANKDVSETIALINRTRPASVSCRYNENLKKSIEIIKNLINDYNNLRIYCNNMLAELSVTYNMSVIQIDENFMVSDRKKKFTSSMLSNNTGAGCSTDPL